MEDLIAKGAVKAASSGVQETQSLMSRVLGPTADYLGDRLQIMVQRRLETVDDIAQNASKKLGARLDERGSVPPKVLKEILDDGSYADTDIAVEYFGGVLASSRSGVSRDDRGASYAKLVAQLTSYQLRAHYFFYSLFRDLYSGSDISINDGTFGQYHGIWMDQAALFSGLALEEDEDPDIILNDLFFGLHRFSLIGASSAMNNLEGHEENWVGCENGGLIITATVDGVNLMLWAVGQGHLISQDFFGSSFETENLLEIPYSGMVTRVSHRYTPKSSQLESSERVEEGDDSISLV